MRCAWYNRIGFLFVTRVMPLAAIAIAPGVDYFPGFLDRAAQAALRDQVLAILEHRAALSPAHAAHRQAVFGVHEQLRASRLGLG